MYHGGQGTTFSSLFSPSTQGLSANHQAWYQLPLPAQPYRWPIRMSFLKCYGTFWLNCFVVFVFVLNIILLLFGNFTQWTSVTLVSISTPLPLLPLYQKKNNNNTSPSPICVGHILMIRVLVAGSQRQQSSPAIPSSPTRSQLWRATLWYPYHKFL